MDFSVVLECQYTHTNDTRSALKFCQRSTLISIIHDISLKIMTTMREININHNQNSRQISAPQAKSCKITYYLHHLYHVDSKKRPMIILITLSSKNNID